MLLGSQAGPWQGAFLGAFVLGIYANLFARWRKLPASIVVLTGVQALLPGALALIGLFDIPNAGIESISTIIIQFLVSVFAIFAGLITANILFSSPEK